jgi:MerR family transcriptional regulator/heat shock protein HspR
VKKLYLQVFRHTLSRENEEAWVNIESLGVHPEIVVRLAELGIVEVYRGHMPAHHVRRLQKAMRLRSSLGVNLPGTAVILDLLDRMEMLQDEIERLKRR